MIGPKTLIIMRGLPGSGKSYLAKKLGESGVVFSTDDFFMEDGNYNFDFTKLPDAHRWNQDRAKSAIENGVAVVVIDNTNVKPWESKVYVEYAIKHGYLIEIRLSETSWAYDLDELVLRNSHKVPRDVIEKMLNNFDKSLTVGDILNSSFK